MVLAFPWGKEMNGAVVTCYPEVSTLELRIVAGVQTINKPAQEHIPADLFISLNLNGVAVKILRVANTIKAGDR